MAGEVSSRPELDDFIEAFEQAQGQQASVDLADFLPPPGHPLHLAVLRELVRVDLEYGWTRGRPTPLEDYRGRFPVLFQDPEAVRAIAFEEYRLRHQAGEALSPAEYRRRYGVTTDDWPTFPARAQDRLSAPASAGDGNSRSDGCRQEEPLRRLREVQSSDPELAYLMAEVMTGLPEVGSDFLGFRLTAELGRGAFGRVYLARQGDLADRPVALKITFGLSAESQTLARLQHTNIVPIYSVHRADPFQAVCMPYFGATTLADVLRDLEGRPSLPDSGKELVSTLQDHKTRSPGCPADQAPGRDGRPLPPPLAEDAILPVRLLEGLTYVQAVLWIGARLTDGLAHAHARGVLHRDLKPANILLTDEGQPMLVDFNLAVLTEDVRLAEAESARVGGTLPYMAPEHLQAFQGESQTVDARSDLYALGVVLYELLAGRVPFEVRRGPVHQVLPAMIADRLQSPPRLRRWNRAVSPAVESIVRHLLEPDPSRRYQTAREVGEDLQRQLEDRPLRHAPEPSLRERTRKWVRRHPRLTSPGSLAAMLIALLAVLAALVLWREVERMDQEKKLAEREIERVDEENRSARVKLLLAEEEKKRALVRQADEALKEFRKTFESVRERQEQVSAVQSLFDRETFEQEQPANDVELCRRALEHYRVLEDPSWAETPEVRQLPPTEREQLRRDVGELLYLLTRATLLQVARPAVFGQKAQWTVPVNALALAPVGAALAAVRARVGLALSLNEQAQRCYPPGQVPRALLVQRAGVAGLAGRQEEFRRLLRQAGAAPTQGARDCYLAGYEYAALEDFRQALALAEEARKREPQRAGTWFLLGLCHANLSSYRQAVGCYQVCLALEPGWLLAHFHRGTAYLDLEDYPAACADFDRVLAERPGLFLARVHRASAREGMGLHAEAADDLTRALEVRPDDLSLYWQRARVRQQLGDQSGARSDRERVLDAVPTDARGWVDQGLARAADDPRGALADYDRALTIDPRCLSALCQKAALLEDRWGDLEQALPLLDRAVRFYPDSVPARLQRGLLRARLGQRAPAHEDAEDCLKQAPCAPTQYEAARIYAQTSRQEKGDRERALQLLRAALYAGYGIRRVETDSRLLPLASDQRFQVLVLASQALGPNVP